MTHEDRRGEVEEQMRVTQDFRRNDDAASTTCCWRWSQSLSRLAHQTCTFRRMQQTPALGAWRNLCTEPQTSRLLERVALYAQLATAQRLADGALVWCMQAKASALLHAWMQRYVPDDVSRAVFVKHRLSLHYDMMEVGRPETPVTRSLLSLLLVARYYVAQPAFYFQGPPRHC